jgi:DNA-binding beta-propeller fold protein YncE
VKHLFCLLLVFVAAMGGEQPSTALKFDHSIPLQDVKGRFDHFALDVKGQRLFVAALGNNTVEVLDVKAGKRLCSLIGCSKPQGLVYLPKPNLLFVANGGDGRVQAYDAAAFKPIVTIGALEDADNLRYDPKLDRLFVGYGDGGIGLINPTTGVLTVRIPLKGHPESFQMESGRNYLFVNVPDAQHIAVIDRQMRSVVATWPLKDFRANFPMALDESNHRMYIGCRSPARLVVLDIRNGRIVADLPISGDTDDLFYDAKRKRIYVSCGEGYIDVIEQGDPDHYKVLERIPTAPGARTSFFSAELYQLYLAVPRRGEQQAEVRVYDIAK